ncbi:Sodium-dependent phosphate transport protein 2B [Orchesella cincta]|uniref:Sodium-dependent phosphate transport protein 2B n=1 Tax=Orchesella cincta TaxID=48709 RepID=A0A1D2N4G0_ORCCI|nr:Sodium-dependent phosphate transport protein 2B [Orchesella cincta]
MEDANSSSNANRYKISNPDVNVNLDNLQYDPPGANSYTISSLQNNGHKNSALSIASDPWAIGAVATAQDDQKSWDELTTREKQMRVLIGIAKGIGLLICLYFFVCSLDCLSLGFRVLGGRTTGDIFKESKFLENPIVGVMIGIMTTVLVQSSSTSTSIIVSMVAADFLEVHVAVPIIMGANIGTSITNTIVSLTQVGDRNQFRRAFAGATVHDMFNWLTVIVLLIIEVTTGYLEKVTGSIMDALVGDNSTSGGEIEILGVITKPFVNLIVQIDKKVLECWSNVNCTEHENSSLIKDNCAKSSKKSLELTYLPMDDFSKYDVYQDASSTAEPSAYEECNFLFAKLKWSDTLSGSIILLGSLLVLCLCLIMIVKILNSVLQGQIAVVIKKTLNAKVPYVPWITGYLALVVGAVMTFLVQSSSVFTSALTPLVGLGVLSVERVYPLTLGSNIGTTTTALIASMAAEGDSFKPSMQIALCHLIFNLTGIALFYPIPFMRFPIRMAKFLGDTTAKYRWFAIVYMVLMFIAMPALFMGLSFAGTPYVIAAAAIICGTFLFVSGVNLLREKRPSILPEFLKSWKWLPIWFRSLEPYDKIFSSFACCRKLKEKNQTHQPRVSTDGFEKVDLNNLNGNSTHGGNVNPAFVE